MMPMYYRIFLHIKEKPQLLFCGFVPFDSYIKKFQHTAYSITWRCRRFSNMKLKMALYEDCTVSLYIFGSNFVLLTQASTMRKARY